jgi:hypothetical protein
MYSIIKTREKIFYRVTRRSTTSEIRQVFVHNKTTSKPERCIKNLPWEIYTTPEDCRRAIFALFVEETLCEKDQVLFAA